MSIRLLHLINFNGQIVSRDHIVHGSVSDFPDALLMLFAGENTGKLILAIDHS